jgi:hypothetical protein
MPYQYNSETLIASDNSFVHKSFDFFEDGDIANTETKLTASDGAANDRYGISVSVGCGRIVIGSRFDDNGSAYIYDLNGTLITKLTAFDGAADDQFGYSVSVGSNKIVVGSPNDDDNGTDSGSAYVYDLNGTLITKLTAFDGAAGDSYSFSVSVGCGRIVIGAYGDDDNGTDSGSAYVYDLNGNLITKLTAFDGAAGDSYSTSVSVGCGRIVIGSRFDDDKETDSGSAYVYDLNGTLITKLTAFDGFFNEWYGSSVSVGCGRIVIGSIFDDDNGSAYVYDLNGTLITKLTALDGAVNDLYGVSVSVGSGRIVIGSELDDDKGTDSGSAYIYKLQETSDIYYENIIQSMSN